MAAYTPTEFIKDGDVEVATTWGEHWQLIWDGYSVVGEAPDYPSDLRGASLADVEIVQEQVSPLVKASQQPLYVPRASMTQQVSEAVTVTTGVAADGAFNEQYVIGSNALPATWPVDAFGSFSIASNTWSPKTSNTGIATVTTLRMMMDGSELTIFTYSGFLMDLFVDGKPYASNPIAGGATSGFAPFGFQKFVFASAKPRLIEIRTIGGLVGVYTKKPYRIWKPQPDQNPKVVVVGDSFVAPTVMNNASAGVVSSGAYDRGIYQMMAADLGITSLVTDGIGGTGYINGGGGNVPYSHASRTAWVAAHNPDVIIMHGGGANDLYQGNSVAAIITAVVARFTALRAAHPKAKLVFVEGFAPPLFTPATYNPNYIAIRQGVQAALIAAKVDTYYIDVATTRPPISGSGYVTAANGTGNSDYVVGSDAVHLTLAGNAYIKAWLAPKIARVLADNRGLLVNTLI